MYVDREAADILSEDDAAELRGRIEERLTPGTLFVAVLPEMVGMTPEDAATELGNRVTVKGSIAAPLLFAVVDELAAIDGQRPGRRQCREQEDDGGIGPVPVILLGLVVAGGAAATIVIVRRRRQPVQS